MSLFPPGWEGRRGRPENGWPLDRLLIGVAAVRVTRELFLQKARWPEEPVRAWDLALWSGASPQSAARALKRMEGLELVQLVTAPRHDRAAHFQLVPDHPLTPPLGRLFAAESAMVPRIQRFRRR